MSSINLKAERLNKGLSIREAAKEIGVAAPTLGRAEQGATNLHPSNALKIANFYGCKVTDIWPVEEKAAA
jgi:transcriptional regulator with XRE-family HTH domain